LGGAAFAEGGGESAARCGRRCRLCVRAAGWSSLLSVVAAAVGLTAVICEACGSPGRNGAAGGSELGLLPTVGDDEENGSVSASGWDGEKRVANRMGGVAGLCDLRG